VSDLSTGTVRAACEAHVTDPVGSAAIEDQLADADPDQEAVARAFAELDKLALMAERATEALKKAEVTLLSLTIENPVRSSKHRDRWRIRKKVRHV
jgi:hypothetical protein